MGDVMFKGRRRSLAAVAVAAGLLLAACSTGADPGAMDTPIPAEITPGLMNIEKSQASAVPDATLTLAELGEPRSLDPTVTSSAGETGGTAMMAIYDSLVRFDVETQ